MCDRCHRKETGDASESSRRDQAISSYSMGVVREAFMEEGVPGAGPNLRSLTQGCGLYPVGSGEPRADAW